MFPYRTVWVFISVIGITRLRAIAVNVLCLLFLSSCSLLPVNEWGTSEVTIEVRDLLGNQIKGVKVESLVESSKLTDSFGRLTLSFPPAGLYIVTLQSPKIVTRQVKVRTPEDKDTVVIVYLKLK